MLASASSVRTLFVVGATLNSNHELEARLKFVHIARRENGLLIKMIHLRKPIGS